MDTLWILLYSKFSPSCKTMFSLLQQHSLQNMFKLLDVDNKNIRQRILNDKKFTIKSVPCIVSVTSSGVASQYEGSKAFEVVNVMIKQTSPPPPPPPPQPQPSPIQNNQTQLESLSLNDNNNTQKITLIEDLLDIDDNTSITASRQSHNFNDIKRETNQFPQHDRNVSTAIKGEKINVSSVMNQAQQTNDQNPPATTQRQNKPPMVAEESVSKKSVEKVNVASIMAASLRN